MGALLQLHRRRRRRLSAAFALLVLAAALGSAVAAVAGEEQDAAAGPVTSQREKNRERVSVPRRRLLGPGSWPPSCRARCGRCFPCRPVHVAIQPGRSFPLEYYPEAWRCKCGDKLFMP